MKDQVVMSPMSGNLCVAIPLYRVQHDESLGKLDGYVVSLMVDKPLMYALDIGLEKDVRAFNAEWVERELEFLGEL